MATGKLATWISTLEFSSLPQPVINAAVRSFQNSLGCIIGGSTHATVYRTIDALKPTFEQGGQCTIFGQSSRNQNTSTTSEGTSITTATTRLQTDASNTALINGIASHVHDYDDTHLHTVIHPAGAVVVALLAYSQSLSSPISGKAFITALVAGIEIGLRVGNAISPNHYSAGWHITGTVSPIAAAAALSSLLHLSAEQTRNAIGLAATQPVGIRVHFGTDTKAFHAGRASQNGILAAQLAQGGFTAAEDALEGRRGWVEVLGNGANSLDEQIGQLLECSRQDHRGETHGESQSQDRQLWEIEKNTFKPFPCGIVIHPIIDACIQLHDELQLSSKRNAIAQVIKSVHLKVHPLVLDLTGKKTPRDGLEAKFSVYHGAAIGLVLGSATPAEYADEIVTSADIVTVRDRVVAEVDENMRSDEAVVTLTLEVDGKTVQKEKHVEHAVGSLAYPMTNEQLKSKFLKQVAPVLEDEKAAEIDSMAWDVLSSSDVARIAEASG